MAERFWTVEEADAALAWVAELVTQAREAVRAVVDAGAEHHAGGNGHVSAPAERADLDDALRELAAEGIVIRDLERGLVDFPAQSPTGRTYLLCWLVDEPAVTWWHWPEDGFAGRTPLSSPPE
jgi:hypothetical protein